MGTVKAVASGWIDTGLIKVINVLDFDAVGDGSADDTAAIQAAFTAAKQETNGVTVYLPAGDYLADARLATLTDSDPRINILGAGQENTKITLSGNLSNPLFSITGSAQNAHVVRFTVSDISFRNPSRAFTGNIFDINRANHVSMTRVYFQSIDGICLDLEEVWDSVFSDCKLVDSGNATNTQPMLKMVANDGDDVDTGCNHIRFISCQFEEPQYESVQLNKHSVANTFVACKWHGDNPAVNNDHLVLDDADRNQVIGCAFQAGGDNYIQIKSGSTDTMITGAHFRSAGDVAIEITDGTRTMIAGCTFTVNTTASVRITAGTLNVYGPSNKSADTKVIVGSGTLGVVFGYGRLYLDEDFANGFTPSSPGGGADNLVIEEDGNAGLSIVTPSDKSGTILFGDDSASNSGIIQYSHSADTLSISTGGGAFKFNSREILRANVGTIASPAGAQLILTGGDFFSITGTNNITSIATASSTNGRMVVLNFAGILTFTDGNNLKLAGDFVTTADDTITLICNGTDWHETARSVN